MGDYGHIGDGLAKGFLFFAGLSGVLLLIMIAMAVKIIWF